MHRPTGKRIEEIDALRGIAAVSVLLFHYTKMYDLFHHLHNSLGFVFSIGYYGVYLFFVISGFVIALTLHRCRTGLDFVVSRFSRIFPAYWTAVILSYGILTCLGARPRGGVADLLLSFTMLERILGLPHIDAVYWTLNVEMSFYFWMFLLFSLGALNKIEKVIPFVLLFQLGIGLFCHWTHHAFGQGIKDFFLLEYAHLFCAGMIFYQIWSDRFTAPRLALLGWCLFNQTQAPFRDFDWFPPFLWGDIAVAVVFCVMALVVRGKLRWLVNPFLLFLGTISYPLYLVHNEIGQVLMGDLAGHGWARWPGFMAALALSFCLAIAITFGLEKPSMRWIRDRYKVWQGHPVHPRA